MEKLVRKAKKGDAEAMQETILAAYDLPEGSRLIFQMYYGEQFSIGEIAQLLHMKENTVKSKIHRGRKQLKSQLDAGKEKCNDEQSAD